MIMMMVVMMMMMCRCRSRKDGVEDGIEDVKDIRYVEDVC